MLQITPNIKFDISEVASFFALSKKQANDLLKVALQDVSNAFAFMWRETASRELNSTRDRYIRGIQQPVIFDNVAIIELIGTLPNMIESGATAFDMKKGFQQSSKIKISAQGSWFLTIPFRWATSNALGENEAFSNKMPKEVYDVAKNLSETKSNIGSKKVIYGSSLKEAQLPKDFQGKKTRQEIKDAEGKVIYGAYKHKSNIYSGITKTQKTYEKATQSQYFSFRRVSENSDPLSWIHPGLMAKNFAEKAINSFDIEEVLNNSANIFANNLGL